MTGHPMPLDDGPEHDDRATSAATPAAAASGAGTAGRRNDADVDVLIVGAGPTGLTAACEARRHGLTARIVDRATGRSGFSKALVVHARTMEVFETMGVADRVRAAGARFAALNVNTRHRAPVRVDLLGLPWGDTAYPFWLSVPQYATEHILESHLTAGGGEVEWGVALKDLRDDDDGGGGSAEAMLEHGDGRRETVRARWVIGCDGGRSRVREAAGLRLDRSDAGAVFVLADVLTTADLTEDEGHVFLGPEGLLLIVPMPEPRRWRVIAHVPEVREEERLTLDAPFLDELIRSRAGIAFGSHGVTWQSRFALSHGLVDHYRRGRVFLAGDAAHIHSPVGGQGLNTGVQDAHNLLWKLAAARRTEPARAEALLDSYEAERRPVARAMVRGTARATRALTTRTGMTRALLGTVAPTLLGRRPVQARLGRGVGMLDIGYPDGGPAAGRTGRGVRTAAGRRLPNPVLRDGGGRLHQRLAPLGFTWVVRARPGETWPAGDDRAWAGIPVVFLSEEEWAGLSRPGTAAPVILVRPDRYIAGAGSTAASVLSAVGPGMLPGTAPRRPGRLTG
ncbi:FAD-dependent monooxygenase [Streptomyces sp. MNU89]|uniref:FAD-dependent monooxygenase n=1 Tax=Streptomyces sp. MNU89 TaxID=2560025 RepID=UPI001E5EAD4D|nr:FAD-dependent monooxygenase [Streptomyces sp. MNU89]MCC9738852.1 FAD-dependent monooxygenase [Streptomyces sp. MNU89]